MNLTFCGRGGHGVAEVERWFGVWACLASYMYGIFCNQSRKFGGYLAKEVSKSFKATCRCRRRVPSARHPARACQSLRRVLKLFQRLHRERNYERRMLKLVMNCVKCHF